MFESQMQPSKAQHVWAANGQLSLNELFSELYNKLIF